MFEHTVVEMSLAVDRYCTRETEAHNHQSDRPCEMGHWGGQWFGPLFFVEVLT